jgi:hypothetical protein
MRALSLVFLVLFALPLRAEENSAPEGHVDFGRLPRDTEDLFMRGARDAAVVSFPEVTLSGDVEMESIWRGKPPVLKTDLPHVRILFARNWQTQEEAKASPASPFATPSETNESEDFFFLFINFHDTKVELKSSRSGLEPEKGLELSGGERKILPVSVVPNRALRMILLVPQVTTPGNFGFFMCPRVYAASSSSRALEGEEPKSIARNYVDGGFRIVAVHATASAKLEGRIVGGFGSGRAAGSILTSVDIPRGIESRDETFTRDPSIALEYTPVKSDPYLSIDGVSSPIVERGSGIEGTVTLHNAAGYLLVNRLRSVFWIKELRYPPEPPLQLNPTVTSGEGVCYILFKERLEQRHYGKEPLALPERLARETPTP